MLTFHFFIFSIVTPFFQPKRDRNAQGRRHHVNACRAAIINQAAYAGVNLPGLIASTPTLLLPWLTLNYIESSPEYKEAKEIVEPILKACVEWDAKEQAAREEHAKMLGAHVAALETAREKALKAALESSEVVAARRALESLTK